MAKPFYSLEEVCSLLSKNEDGVKALVRDGQLREFRDAGKVFFKADDVDKLRTSASSAASASGEISLEPADEELPTLGSGTGMNMGSGSGGGASGGTSLIGLAPADEEPPKDKKGGTVLSASGIGVFDDDELEIDVDPLAATHVSGPTKKKPPAAKADEGAAALEGTGSGLLDLQREADDTKLGAELLDEIYPGEEDEGMLKTPTPAPPAQRAPSRPAPVQQADDDEEEEAVSTPMPTPALVGAGAVVVSDPLEGMFAGLLAGTLLPLALAGSVGMAALQGFLPDYAEYLAVNFWFFIGGAVLVPAIGLLVGWVVGRAK